MNAIDWGEFENDRCWRVRIPDGSRYGDGRFRWMLHDGDDVFVEGKTLKEIDDIQDSVLYKNLIKNVDFKNRLKQRFYELGDTTFSDENIRKELSKDKWDEPEIRIVKVFFMTHKETIKQMLDDGL